MLFFSVLPPYPPQKTVFPSAVSCSWSHQWFVAEKMTLLSASRSPPPLARLIVRILTPAKVGASGGPFSPEFLPSANARVPPSESQVIDVLEYRPQYQPYPAGKPFVCWVQVCSGWPVRTE